MIRRSHDGSGIGPDHHDPEGGFRNPWPTFGARGNAFRWALQRVTGKLPSDPDPDEIPRAVPTIGGPGGQPSTGMGTGTPSGIRATWVGHATFLLEMGGLNILTDPHWSERASPVSWAGPKRLSPPGIAFDALPPIDAVLLSHDHLDHLDEETVRALARRHGPDTLWLAPLGYADILRKWGATRITEMDWFESVELGPPEPGSGRIATEETNPPGDAVVLDRGLESAGNPVRVTCLPAQHWSARSPFGRNRRLWSSWSVRAPRGSVYFGGDSGWFPGYPEIGRRAGPFDLVLLPIGAYAPRWFMKPVHMDPAEAVRSYQELGGRGVFAGMHWGTFRLSDEHPLEPPARVRDAWNTADLPADRLWIPAIGETRRVPGDR